MPTTPELAVLLQDPRLWRAGALAQTLATVPAGHPALAALLPGGGWPVGAISELCYERAGCGELALILPALVALCDAGRAIAFLGAEPPPYAPALAAAGLDLARVLCIEATDDAHRVWAAEQLLSSPACGAVVFWARQLPLRELRRIQLAAGRGGSLAFLLRPAACAASPSPAALRLAVVADVGGIRVQVRKSRGPRRDEAVISLDPGALGQAQQADGRPAIFAARR